jgi:hypothetical protein
MHCSRRRFIIVAASLASTSILVDEAEAHTLAWPLCHHGTDCDARENPSRGTQCCAGVGMSWRYWEGDVVDRRDAVS